MRCRGAKRPPAANTNHELADITEKQIQGASSISSFHFCQPGDGWQENHSFQTSPVLQPDLAEDA